MRFLVGLILGALIGFGVALWFQGEPPFSGSAGDGRGGITIGLSDRYLTGQAGPAIAARGNGALSHVRVRSSAGDIVYVEAIGTAAGVSGPVGVSLQPTASAGTIVLTVRSGHIGPLPIPNVVIAPLVDVINNRIGSLISSSPFAVTGVGTTASGIEVFLSPR